MVNWHFDLGWLHEHVVFAWYCVIGNFNPGLKDLWPSVESVRLRSGGLCWGFCCGFGVCVPATSPFPRLVAQVISPAAPIG